MKMASSDSVWPRLSQRQEEIYRGWKWLAEAVESSILHSPVAERQEEVATLEAPPRAPSKPPSVPVPAEQEQAQEERIFSSFNII